MEESADDVLDSMMDMFEMCCECLENEVDERRYDIMPWNVYSRGQCQLE